MIDPRLPASLLLISLFIDLLAGTSPARAAARSDGPDPEKGLIFELRDAPSRPVAPRPEARIEPLAQADADAIFARLPPFAPLASDRSDLQIRPDSLPPPKPGRVLPMTLGDPSEQRPDPVSGGSLTIVRAAPQGPVSSGADLSVTFSEPMVAVGSQSETAKIVPATISPEPPGRWRWLGTRTLLFDPVDRLPMATEYTVTVPAGTRSLAGNALASEVRWKFSTPTPRLSSLDPTGGSVAPDATIVATFDQRIDPEKVLANASATAADGQSLGLRLATADEVAQYKFPTWIKSPPLDRIVFLKTKDPMPLATRISVTFGKGMPSAEGPLTTTDAAVAGFETYGPLGVTAVSCKKGTRCPAREGVSIDFSNPIDTRLFDATLVRIEPPVEDPGISVWDDRIYISDLGLPRSLVRVTVSGKLTDKFGQSLGNDRSFAFRTAPEDPELLAFDDEAGFATVDPFARPFYSVWARNFKKLKARIYAVTPDDFAAYRRWRKGDNDEPLPEIGRLVVKKGLAVEAKPDEFGEARLDLSPAFAKGLGHAVVVIEPDARNGGSKRIVTWIQSTRIAVDTFVDRWSLTAFVSELRTGRALEGAEIRLASGESAYSGVDGLVTIDLPRSNNAGDFLVARAGDDTAMLFANSSGDLKNRWKNNATGDELRWFVFDDRAIYRPGERVSVKGYVRRLVDGKTPDIESLGAGARTVAYVLTDPRGNQIARGQTESNAFGAFDLGIDLPPEVNLGTQTLTLGIGNSGHQHTFRVEEFRRPEFEVSVKNDSPAPYIIGETAVAAVEAKYYAGGALSNAAAVWSVSASKTNFTPPNREDFTFGEFVPWWRYRSFETTVTRRSFESKTDGDGRHRLALDLVSSDSPEPYAVTAEARVTDVNRQTIAGSTTMLVHPAEYYVGLRTDRSFVQPNETIAIDAVVTDIGGAAVAGVPISIVAELKQFQQVKGEWQDVSLTRETCEVRSRDVAAQCVFNAPKSGRFEFTATIADTKGRKNRTRTQVWIAGEAREPAIGVEAEEIEIVPARAQYRPGETAEILVNAPVSPAEGLLTIMKRGVVRTERFRVEGPSTVLKIPVTEDLVPGFRVQVDLFGAARRIVFDDDRDLRLPDRPAFASGGIDFEVSTATRRLAVSAVPRAAHLAPGGETEIDVAVTDDAGRPRPNAEVALVAVDESVLALTKYSVADPLGAIYSPIAPDVDSRNIRETVRLGDLEDLVDDLKSFGIDGVGRGPGFGSGSGLGNGSGEGGGNGVSFGLYDIRRESDSPFRRLEIITGLQRPPAVNGIRMRSNFNALALFSPTVRTDPEGRATVKLKLPDNLTRYRITAVATDGAKRFGKTESAVTARQPLMVRPSAPRFLNYGDRAEIPIVIQNQSNSPVAVDVAVRAANAELTAWSGRRVTVPANDREEVRFPVTTDSAGLARFQVGAVAANDADAAEFAVPVLTPVTTESFATYGTTDSNGAISLRVDPPKGALPEFGGFELTTSSTQLQELTDAYIYLQAYPFECSEQVSSRMLATVALRDVLSAFDAVGLPPKALLEERMAADIAKLVKLQHGDGGWNFWSASGDSHPYVSVHVAHALARARGKGYAVPEETMTRAIGYLRDIESRSGRAGYIRAGLTISAYALYVRDIIGDRDAKKARRIANAGGNGLGPDAIGWLLPVLAGDKDSGGLVAELKRRLLDAVTETAGAANFGFADDEEGRSVLASSRRTDGIVLEALLRTRSAATDDLVPKLARGLLGGRVRGRWRNTQENAFALLALDRYFATFEKETPDLVARVWINDRFAGEQSFRGRSTDSRSINVPMRSVFDSGGSAVTIDRQGTGRLYYRLGMRYAPAAARIDAADLGFEVERKYEAVDDPADVRREPDGSWTIRSGARVRIRVTLVAPSRRYEVALVDRLPGGFEIINSNLATGESVPTDRSERWGRWFDHQNLRDDRAEVFKSLLAEGIRTFTYFARATTPGEFVVPPAKAEEMYAPETFGRTATDVVRIR